MEGVSVMTTLAEQSAEVKREVAHFRMLEWLRELEAEGRHVISASDLQSELSDLCLDLRCGWGDLPEALNEFHKEVGLQIGDPHHGAPGFIVRNLINSVEREGVIGAL